MDTKINELMKTFASNLDLKEFKGDIVGVKYVENEFGTIESGGIGKQIIYYGSDRKQDSEETKEDEDLILHNEIFNYNIFNTQARLERLRDEIGARIAGARLADEGRFNKDMAQIDPSKKNQWYCIWKAVQESGLLNNQNDNRCNFIKQMIEWYPEVLDAQEYDKFVKNLGESLTDEKRKWTGKDGKETPIRDMSAKWQELNIKNEKYKQMYLVCNDLLKALQQLKSEFNQ